MMTHACFCMSLRQALIFFCCTEAVLGLLGFYSFLLLRLYYDFVPFITNDPTSTVLLYLAYFSSMILSTLPLGSVVIFCHGNIPMTIASVVFYVPLQTMDAVLFLYAAYYIQHYPHTSWPNYKNNKSVERHLYGSIIIVIAAVANYFYFFYKILILSLHLCRKWEEYQSNVPRNIPSSQDRQEMSHDAGQPRAHFGREKPSAARPIGYGEIMLNPEDSESTLFDYAEEARRSQLRMEREKQPVGRKANPLKTLPEYLKA